MASLGWVTPGAATEGVTALFFYWKTWRSFLVASFAVSPGRPFLLIALSLFIAFSQVSPPQLEGVTLHLSYLSDLVSSLLFVNLPTKNFLPSGVTPLEGVTRGGPPPPPIDATAVTVQNKNSPIWALYLFLFSLTLHLRQRIRPFTTNKTPLRLLFTVIGSFYPCAPPGRRWSGWSAPALTLHRNMIIVFCSLRVVMLLSLLETVCFLTLLHRNQLINVVGRSFLSISFWR